jgi:hypothetical protein
VAWTNPKTWSFGEILTSTDMNTYVRDNTEELFDGAGSNLVAVKYAIKTDTQSSSLAAGAQANITGLSIAHAAANSSNQIILLSNVVASNTGTRNYGVVFTAAGSNIAVGDTDGNRRRVTTAFKVSNVDGADVASGALMAQHLPGSTSSVTYTVAILNANTSTETLHVNRATSDTDAGTRIRGVSSLILLEVRA